jgi:hypothetical protein
MIENKVDLLDNTLMLDKSAMVVALNSLAAGAPPVKALARDIVENVPVASIIATPAFTIKSKRPIQL